LKGAVLTHCSTFRRPTHRSSHPLFSSLLFSSLSFASSQSPAPLPLLRKSNAATIQTLSPGGGDRRCMRCRARNARSDSERCCFCFVRMSEPWYFGRLYSRHGLQSDSSASRYLSEQCTLWWARSLLSHVTGYRNFNNEVMIFLLYNFIFCALFAKRTQICI